MLLQNLLTKKNYATINDRKTWLTTGIAITNNSIINI